ncbi:MAG: hypothetical protein R2911_07500 [Caldilineaceae bacterium]
MKSFDPFEQGLAAGEAAASAAGGAASTAKNGGRMYVRTQGFGSTDAELRFLQRCGVRHKAATFPSIPASVGNSTSWSRSTSATKPLA